MPRIDIIAIGVSTGGPQALTEIFRQLPERFPVPIVIVQHMPPLFTKFLSERLDAVSTVKVCEAVAGDILAPGEARLAPGSYHMALRRQRHQVAIELHQGPAENSCRPSADVLFRSVAQVYGPGALAVVLTGMGQDGLRGCEAIVAAGGRVLVQDEATSVVWGMPRAVAEAGLASAVLPLGQISAELTNQVNRFRGGPAATRSAIASP
jgi:two-component system, chemotaxis family, protein-glutamate methylesterase/glutaminase